MLHIIFTKDGVIISKKSYSSWREIQDEFRTYKASLGPWDQEQVAGWLSDEYPDLLPSAHAQVEALMSRSEEFRPVQFRASQ